MKQSTVMSTLEISRHLGLNRETLRRLSCMRLCTEHPQPRLLKLLVVVKKTEPRLSVISVKQCQRTKGLKPRLNALLKREGYLGFVAINLRFGLPIRRSIHSYKVQGQSLRNSGLFKSKRTSEQQRFLTNW